MAYVTFFPIGTTMRANLFVYRDMADPWLRQMRKEPEAALLTLQPSLRKLPRLFRDLAAGQVFRPVLSSMSPAATGRPASCWSAMRSRLRARRPAPGRNKVFTDAERLCHVHVPRWLAEPGMGADKIASFYDDEVKLECDAACLAKALHLRSLSIETGAAWHARRWLRFVARLGAGSVRQARGRLRRFPKAASFWPRRSQAKFAPTRGEAHADQ